MLNAQAVNSPIISFFDRVVMRESEKTWKQRILKKNCKLCLFHITTVFASSYKNFKKNEKFFFL